MLLFGGLVLTLLTGLGSFLVVDLDYTTDDGRTKAFKRRRRLLYVVTVIATISACILDYGNDATQKKEQAELKDKLANITGEDSIPYLVPQTHVNANTIPLRIHSDGKHLLSGVEVTIRNQQAFTAGGDLAFFSAPVIPIGELPPDSFGRPLPSSSWITPHPDATGIDKYFVEIYTQAGLFTEMIEFRRGKNDLPWACRWWVNKQTFTATADGGTDVASVAKSQSEWTDDQGEGKPLGSGSSGNVAE